MSVDAQTLYGRLSSVRIDDALIEEAIELGLLSMPARVRDEAADRLENEDQAAVLRKEVADVVILVTSALEAPTVTVYQDIVALVEPQPFDEVTAPFKRALMRKMALDALDEVDASNELRVLDLLHVGLRACGDGQPLAPFKAAPAA